MNLSPEHLVALRAYLKEFTASSTDAEHQEQIDVINSLIPALVDSISDEEFTVMSNEMWGYVMTGIITTTWGDSDTPKEEENSEKSSVLETP